MNHLEFNKIIDGKFIGYHDDITKLPIKKGDIVLIKKGTRFHSMKDGWKIAQRSYKIKVFSVGCGSQWIENGKEIYTNPEITWVGSGYYWNRVDINDVEVVNEN